MKHFIAVLTVATLPFNAASADVIDTFKSTCLSGLPNAKVIAQRGTSMGFSMANLYGDTWIGFNEKADQSLQLNVATRNSFECAVTTSDVSDPNALRKEFFSDLGLRDRRGVAKGKINGQTYFFKHDTNGGEALVVFAK